MASPQPLSPMIEPQLSPGSALAPSVTMPDPEKGECGGKPDASVDTRGQRAERRSPRGGSSWRGPTILPRRRRLPGVGLLGAGHEIIAVDVHVPHLIEDQRGRRYRRGLGGQPQMSEDAPHDEGIGETGEDLPAAAAARTPQHIHEEDPSEELRPGEPPAATTPGHAARCPGRLRWPET